MNNQEVRERIKAATMAAKDMDSSANSALWVQAFTALLGEVAARLVSIDDRLAKCEPAGPYVVADGNTSIKSPPTKVGPGHSAYLPRRSR